MKLRWQSVLTVTVLLSSLTLIAGDDEGTLPVDIGTSDNSSQVSVPPSQGLEVTSYDQYNVSVSTPGILDMNAQILNDSTSSSPLNRNSSGTTESTTEGASNTNDSSETTSSSEPTATVPLLPIYDPPLSIWALVSIGILLSIAAVLTLIYFLRHYSKRRRESDRKRLLSSVSQEGFFVGSQDGRYDHAL